MATQGVRRDRMSSEARVSWEDGMDSGHDINGLHPLYGIHGDGAVTAALLLHGGVMTIELTYASSCVPTLTQHHRLIGVDFQAHGRTADIDRDLTYANLASVTSSACSTTSASSAPT